LTDDDLTVSAATTPLEWDLSSIFSSIRALVCGGKPAVYGPSMESWMTGDVVNPFVSLAAGIAVIDSE